MTVPYRQTTFVRPSSGAALVCHLWEPPSPARTVWIVHGFAEHGGRYHGVADSFASAGMAVACMDLWGHGKSAGRRGDVERYEEYLDDLELLRAHLRGAWKAPEASAVFGHSFGGMLAVHWALRHPELAVLVMQSPLLDLGFPVPPWKLAVQEFLVSVWPALTLPLDARVDWLARDPAIGRAYNQDPLVHHQITLRAYREMQRAMREARERGAGVQMPTLMMWGTEDHIISRVACRAFVSRLRCESQAREFPGALHELHHEPVKQDALELACRWMLAHAG